MTRLAVKDTLVTIAEFEAFMETRPEDWRLYDLIAGRIVLMTNPTRRHGKVVSNITLALNPAMRRRGCETFAGDVRVQRSHDSRGTDKPLPDILVRCGRSDAAADLLTYVTDPVVVVEVLSPSTSANDLGAKLAFYASLESVRHIVLVHQDRMRVEHRARTESEPWGEPTMLTEPTDRLDLSAVDVSIPLAEVYFDVAFEQ